MYGGVILYDPITSIDWLKHMLKGATKYLWCYILMQEYPYAE